LKNNKKKDIIIRLCILLIICYSQFSYGQKKEFAQYSFNIDDGLSQNSVNCIIKDKRGFVWLGTEDGLNRYNGVDVTIFSESKNIEIGLLNSAVTCLLEDRVNNLIYIGTNGGGLSVFNPKYEKFKHYTYRDSGNCILSNYTYGLCMDKDGYIWIATSHGLSCFNPKDETFDNYESSDEVSGSFPYVSATEVFIDSDNNVWVGTFGKGIIKLNNSERSYEEYLCSKGKQEYYNNNIIEDIEQDTDPNILLVATNSGFYHFNKTTGEYELKQFNGSIVSDIETGTNGDVWLSSSLNGLMYIDKDENVISYVKNPHDLHTLKENYLRCLYLDERGHLWVGTKSHGFIHLNISNHQFFHYYQTNDQQGVNGQSVFALEKDTNNNMWIGTIEGMSIWNYKTDQVSKYYPFGNEKDFSVWTMLHDDSDILWIGSTRGLIKHNKKTRKNEIFTYFEGDANCLPNNEVYAIERDEQGRLWIGTAYGLARLDENTRKFTNYYYRNEEGALSNNQIWDIHCDKKGVLWIATNGGLNIYQPGKDQFKSIYKYDKDSTGLSSSNVLSIYEDKRGRIWVATDSGINQVNSDLEVVRRFGSEEGLSNNFTYRILEKDNELWVSTNRGIDRIKLNTAEVINYNVHDGLQSNEFNAAANCIDDGRFLFGGINGFNVFHPDSIKQSVFEPPIYFTSLELYGKPISIRDTTSWDDVVIKSSIIEAQSLSFAPNERFFTLDFAALDYQAPSQIQYYYRMLPNSEDWIPVNSQRNLTFINLSAGKYHLEVRSTNAEGYLCNNTKRIEIIVHPPFWKRPWFILMSMLLLIILVYVFVRLRMLKLRQDKEILEKRVLVRTKEIQDQRNIAHAQRDEIARQKKELEDFASDLESKVEKRTEELKNAKEEAEESDRLKSAFLSNMSHEIRTPMNAIMGFSELLLDQSFSDDEKMDFAHLIRTNGDNLLHLLNDIIDISMIESGQLKMIVSEVDVTSLVKEVFETFKTSKQLSDKVNLSFQLECTDEQIVILSDAYRLRQILNNLISNAIKFTDSGYINVSLKVKDSQVFISVEDSGIGINLEHQTRIFDRFLKIENSSTNLYAGNGLGLTITKNLVEILNGKIGLESEPGVGTKFYFLLPLIEN